MFLSENNLCNGYAVTMCLNDSNFPVTRCPKVLALLQLVRSWDVTNCQFCLQAEPDRLTGPGWALHLDAMWKKTSRSREGYLKKKNKGCSTNYAKSNLATFIQFSLFSGLPAYFDYAFADLLLKGLWQEWIDCRNYWKHRQRRNWKTRHQLNEHLPTPAESCCFTDPNEQTARVSR